MNPEEITLVTSIRNRNRFLNESIKGWINFPFKNILIFDMRDESCERAWDVVKPLNDPRVVCYETRYEYFFSNSIGTNALIDRADSKYILKLDSDICLDSTFFKLHSIDRPRHYFGGTDGMGLFGSFLIRKDFILESGGMDENFYGYGREDSELFERLSGHDGAICRPFYGGLRHIEHDNEARVCSTFKLPANSSDEFCFKLLKISMDRNDAYWRLVAWNNTFPRIRWSETSLENRNNILLIRKFT